MSNTPLWFAGDCDRILFVLDQWFKNYWDPRHPVVREELAIIDYTHPDGKRKIPTVVRVYVPLRRKDLDYMINIIQALRPNNPKYKRLADMLDRTRSILEHSRKLPGQQFGKLYFQDLHLTPMDFRRSDVRDLISIMEEARSGKKVQTLEEQLTGKKA